MRASLPLPLLVVSLFTISGCGNAHLNAANRYLAEGNSPLAIEILGAGVAKEAGNQELKDALIVTQQSYQYEIRQEVERLKESKRYLLAMARLVEMEELSRRAAELQTPAEDPADVERERRKTIQSAAEALELSMDERAGRRQDVKADLVACRQLLSLVGSDPGVESTCNRLRSRFKLIVVLEEIAGSHEGTGQVFGRFAAGVKKRNPELFEVASLDAGRHTAVMRLHIGLPTMVESDFVLVKRDKYHKWIPKLNKKGKQVEETVTVKPTKEEIKKAKKAGKKPPKPKKVKKKVWEEVEGEYRHFRAFRSVSVPFRVEIEGLRKHDVPVALASIHTETSESTYHEYEGHPRATKATPGSPAGSRRARPLAPEADLVQRILARLPKELVTEILERVE